MASTPLLGLSLPADGTTNWGTLVNTSITALLDSAVAGTTTLSSDADVTLTDTTEASNQSRQAVLLCTGARAALRTITAPARSKAYIVINNTSGGFGVKIVGTGPTTGVTVANGASALVTWNGSDFVVIGSTTAGDLSVSGLFTAKNAVVQKSSAIGASNIDLSLGNVFSKTISTTTTFTVSNVPASGSVASFILDLTNGGSATVNWWSGVKWANGLAPGLTTSGRDVLGFFTYDGGSIWNGFLLGSDMK